MKWVFLKANRGITPTPGKYIKAYGFIFCYGDLCLNEKYLEISSKRHLSRWNIIVTVFYIRLIY